jgi:hypothetical protein
MEEVLDIEQEVSLQNVSNLADTAKVAYKKVAIPKSSVVKAGGTVTYWRTGFQVTAAFRFTPISNPGWKLTIGYQKGFKPQDIGSVNFKLVTNSIRTKGGMMYCNGNGFTMIIDSNLGDYEVRGTVTYYTTDNFPS